MLRFGEPGTRRLSLCWLKDVFNSVISGRNIEEGIPYITNKHD